MSVRPQTAALIVLLVVMGFVFVLVGEAGVSTQVFKPTATPINRRRGCFSRFR